MKKIILVLAVVFLTACASGGSLKKSDSTLDTSKQSVLLLSLDLGRHIASRYIPYPQAIRFAYKDAQGKYAIKAIVVDKDAGESASEISNKFLLSASLEPGRYKLESIIGRANAFPFIGHFWLPLLLEFDVPVNSVVHVGHINAMLRPRVGEEFRAGSVIPLLDQSATGISGSTFDVEVSDATEKDISEFKDNFPVLQNFEINKQILPRLIELGHNHGGKLMVSLRRIDSSHRGHTLAIYFLRQISMCL